MLAEELEIEGLFKDSQTAPPQPPQIEINLFTRHFPRTKKKKAFDRRRTEQRVQQVSIGFPDRRKGNRRMGERRKDRAAGEVMPHSDERMKSCRRKVEWEDYSKEFIAQRREWLSKCTGAKLDNVGHYSYDAQAARGNIENVIGAVQVPLGIAGPLLINGEHANGTFFVPLSTTEGSLIMTYQWGMQAISLSGGATVRVLGDRTHISPIFKLNDIKESVLFKKWIEDNFIFIKKEAEKTTRFGKLLSIRTQITGNKVILVFFFDTADAAGQNMVAIAAEEACKYIAEKTGLKYYLKSNFCSDKKISYFNMIEGYGKNVIAEIVVPKRVCKKVLNVLPEEFYDFYYNNVMSSKMAGMVGVNGHFANGLAALFLACGQDIAHIANSHLGITFAEVTKDGDLYMSVYLPSLVVASVGGGTHLGTQHECLKALGCSGHGKAKKLAEIAAATVLAGELAIGSALAKGTFAAGHLRHGRRS